MMRDFRASDSFSLPDGGPLAGIVALADIAHHLQSEASFSAVAGVELARTLAAIPERRPEISAAAE